MLRTFFYDHPHYHLKLFPTTTTFGIFLNHVVAYCFTYTMVSARFLRNVPILRYTFKYNYSPIFVFYSLDWMHCSALSAKLTLCEQITLGMVLKRLQQPSL